jgi:hypothetical protein
MPIELFGRPDLQLPASSMPELVTKAQAPEVLEEELKVELRPTDQS